MVWRLHGPYTGVCGQGAGRILPHETSAGVGGIFFDRKQPTRDFGFDRWVDFTVELATVYPELYVQIIRENWDTAYTESHLLWQKIRRGRYVEFNLIYDRGTRFGLESGGNTESILVSLPPEAQWDYRFVPEEGSPEEETLQHLRKNIDWTEK